MIGVKICTSAIPVEEILVPTKSHESCKLAMMDVVTWTCNGDGDEALDPRAQEKEMCDQETT
jgi:hypothetical protein